VLAAREAVAGLQAAASFHAAQGDGDPAFLPCDGCDLAKNQREFVRFEADSLPNMGSVEFAGQNGFLVASP
jgi:hypothetical protein